MLLRAITSLLRPESKGSDALQGISDSFEATLHHSVVPGTPAILAAALLVGAMSFAVLRRSRSENAAARARDREREELRREASSTRTPDRREYARVPTRMCFAIPRSSVWHGLRDRHETQDVSGGGLSFSSQAPPRLGEKVDLMLDIGKPRELSVQAEVVRVSPSHAPGGSAIVGLAFRQLASSTREELLRWLAAEQLQQIAAERRGPVCTLCKRPVAEADSSTHRSCAEAAKTPRRAPDVSPLRRTG